MNEFKTPGFDKNQGSCNCGAESHRACLIAKWHFKCPKVKVLPIDTAVMLGWGKLVADLEKQGQPMPAIDSLLAATAWQGRLTLVTRNEGGFAVCGVAVVNPWKP